MCIMVATTCINRIFEDGFLPRNPSIDIAREDDINKIEVLIDAHDLPKDCRTADDRARAVWCFRENLFENVLKIHFR
jgi:hypothetical protein